MAGKILAIYRCAESGDELESINEAQLDAGKGLLGDRNYNTEPEDQVTLVDADVIARVNAATGWSLTPADTRRNIVTSGIDLNQWETSRFAVGDTLLEGVELCEPCAYLGDLLQTPDRSPADVVKALTHLGGLRARVVRGGIVRLEDPVRHL